VHNVSLQHSFSLSPICVQTICATCSSGPLPCVPRIIRFLSFRRSKVEQHDTVFRSTTDGVSYRSVPTSIFGVSYVQLKLAWMSLYVSSSLRRALDVGGAASLLCYASGMRSLVFAYSWERQTDEV
jgi:hypothetical protein